MHNLDALRKWAQQQFGTQADGMLAAYPAATDTEAYDAATHASGDYLFLQGTRSVLRAAAKANPKTYQYQFTRLNGIGRKIKWGVFHASELPYVFGTLPDSAYGTQPSMLGDFSPDPDSYSDQDARLSKAMSARLGSGSPRPAIQTGRSLASWPRFGEGKESYLEFGDQIVVKTALRKSQIDFLTGFSTSQRARNSAATAANR